jgi:Myc proto-oncogene protein
LIFVVLVRKHPYALFLALSTFPYFFEKKKNKNRKIKMAMTQHAPMPSFNFDQRPMQSFDAPMSAQYTPYNSVMLCEDNFLEGAQSLSTSAELPFRGLTADIPDDLLSITPNHGWDTPPDSPVHEASMFEGMMSVDDSILSAKSSFFADDLSGKLNQQQQQQINTFDAVDSSFEWTPPASPVPSSNGYASASDYSSGNEFEGDDLLQGSDTFMDFPSFAEAIVPASPKQKSSTKITLKVKAPKASAAAAAAAAQQGTLKRKASVAMSDDEKRRLKVKAEAERVERTNACEEAVAMLADSKNDEDPESRRHTHNVLERKRRNDLKNSYQLLREQLPALEENDRAPTGQILLHAVEYIDSLNEAERDLMQKLAAARLEGQRLRALRM